MRIVPITADDEDLTVRLECDPEVMLHIGGPRPEADVRAAHKRRLDLMEKDAARMFKVVADDSDEVLARLVSGRSTGRISRPTKWAGLSCRSIRG